MLFEDGTREYAQNEVANKIIERKKTFCPLCNGTCHADCYCYAKPKLTNTRQNNILIWTCTGGYCTAHALVGSME